MTTDPPGKFVHHPIFARIYARMSVGMERELANRRRRLLAGLHGRVIEVGAIGAAGFVVGRCERFRFPESRAPSLTAPHVLGAAHRPAG